MKLNWFFYSFVPDSELTDYNKYKEKAADASYLIQALCMKFFTNESFVVMCARKQAS